MNLGAVDRDHSDRGQPRLRAESEHAAEEASQRVLVTLDEPRDRRVIGALMRRDHAERHVFFAGPLDRPRRPHTARVGVEHKRDQLDSTGRRNAVWPVTLKLGSDELTFWVTAAVVVEARPEGGPERR